MSKNTKDLKIKIDQVSDDMFVSVDVAFLTYNANRDIAHPIVKLDGTCYAGPLELDEHMKLKRKEKFLMGTDAYNHYKWYNSCLMFECYKLDSADNKSKDVPTKLQIRHWNIESGNIEAFKMQGVTYKAVSMIISPTVEYWYCSNQGPNALPTFGSKMRDNNDLNTSTTNDENQHDGKIHICDVRFTPPHSPTHLVKCSFTCNNSNKPTLCVNNNKISEDHHNNSNCSKCSSVLKAIDVLNQKKNILRHGSPKLQDSQNRKNSGLKPIFEDHLN